MHVVINALPTTNPSGRHVLTGHLARIAPWTQDTHRFTVLHHAANADLKQDFGPNVRWHECPANTSRWPGRIAWEGLALSRLLRHLGADLLFNLSGSIVPGVATPQMTYAMNPWALVPGIQRTALERLKATLQRRAYRRAVRQATAIAFLSVYMRVAYRRNAGCDERASEVVPVGLDDGILEAAARPREREHRQAHQILTVSVMGRHKSIETLVASLAVVRRDHDPKARLVLAGPWHDASYERSIRSLVTALGLGEAVTFTGHLTRSELHRLYSESMVFALMSRCESFGIPGLEAQAFGTPVVGSDSCAMPEVCADGGLFLAEGDIGGAARAVGRLLTDPALWAETSRRATANAARYRWESCSRSLLRLLEVRP